MTAAMTLGWQAPTFSDQACEVQSIYSRPAWSQKEAPRAFAIWMGFSVPTEPLSSAWRPATTSCGSGSSYILRTQETSTSSYIHDLCLPVRSLRLEHDLVHRPVAGGEKRLLHLVEGVGAADQPVHLEAGQQADRLPEGADGAVDGAVDVDLAVVDQVQVHVVGRAVHVAAEEQDGAAALDEVHGVLQRRRVRGGQPHAVDAGGVGGRLVQAIAEPGIVSAELERQPQARLTMPGHTDPGGAHQARQLDEGKADRSIPEDHDALARLDAGLLPAVQAAAHQLGGGGRVGAHARGDLDHAARGEHTLGHVVVVRHGAVVIAADDAAADAQVIQALQARLAAHAGDDGGD